MRKLFCLVMMLGWAPGLWAQVNSCPDQYKAYNATGQEVTQFCVGQPIRFKSCLLNTQPDKEYYDFDKSNGVSFSTDTTKLTTYTKPGTYTVTQLINTGQISQKERTFVVVDTPPPVFTALACSQNQVRVTITDKNYDNFLVDFGDGTTQKLSRGASVIHQFSPGTAIKIQVIASYTGATCTQKAELAVSPLHAPTVPVLENIKIATPGAGGTLELSLKNLQPEYFYVLERIAGTVVTTIDTLKNPPNPAQAYSINNIDANIPVCFRLKITDRCGSNLNLSSNTICSQTLTATASNNQVNLSWPLYPDNSNQDSYALYRNGALLQTLPVNAASFIDNQVLCGTNYCYELRAVLKNNYTAISNENCLTASNNQKPPAGTLTSTFTPDNKVILNFTSPGITPAKTITYQRSANGNIFTSLTATDKLTVTDVPPDPDNIKYCYQSIFEDNCGKISAASNTTCPIVLKAALNPNGNISLNWSEYVGFMASGAQYYLERVNANGTVLSSTPVSGSSYNDKINSQEQQQYYRIKAITANPSEITYSNTASILQESTFRIPTAFSPNGDNLNDRFEIKGKVFGNFRLQILDRWGQIIFVSTNPEIGWDGRIKGQNAPVGVYVYSLSTNSSSGKQITKTGSFTLVR